MMRYVRAFIKALQMTARGETIDPTPKTPQHFLPLEAWINEGLRKLAFVQITADNIGLDQDRRDHIFLKLDGHETSFKSALQMVRHNMVNEYPRLMQLDDAYTMMVVQSSNMNDQYRVSQFMMSDDIKSQEVKKALEDLNEHLMNLPSIEYPDETAIPAS